MPETAPDLRFHPLVALDSVGCSVFSDGPQTAQRRPGIGVVAVTASPYDAPLSALREHVENLAAWIGVWEGHKQPDAFARRCASDAVDAIDGALRDLYLVRRRLTAEIRQADDATAARANELLRQRTVRTPMAESASGGDVPNRDHP